MITKENTKIIDDMTEEYAQELTSEVSNMTSYVKRATRFGGIICCLIILVLIALNAYGCSRIEKFRDLLNTGLQSEFLLFVLSALFAECLLVYRGYKAVMRKMIANYNKNHNELIKRMQDFVTIRGILDDFSDNKMTILKVNNSFLHVRCTVDKKLKTIDIPVKCKKENGDRNIVKFFNDHIEIMIDKNMETNNE